MDSLELLIRIHFSDGEISVNMETGDKHRHRVGEGIAGDEHRDFAGGKYSIIHQVDQTRMDCEVCAYIVL